MYWCYEPAAAETRTREGAHVNRIHHQSASVAANTGAFRARGDDGDNIMVSGAEKWETTIKTEAAFLRGRSGKGWAVPLYDGVWTIYYTKVLFTAYIILYSTYIFARKKKKKNGGNDDADIVMLLTRNNDN